MRVILTRDVPNLGQAGDIKEVKQGYGFNYLMPEGLAEVATPSALKAIKSIIARAKQERDQHLATFAEAIRSLDGQTVSLSMKAKDGKLFGAVTKRAICQAVAGRVSEDMIVLDHPIKQVGEYAVPIVAGDTKATLTLTVVSQE